MNINKSVKKYKTLEEKTIDLQEQEHKHHKLFDKFAILDLSDEQKSEIAKNIIEDLNTGVEYRSQMLLAGVIASLGLLVNSSPVVIGAMLVAPIMRPIQAMAFATTSGNQKLFFRASVLLLSSIAITIAISFLLTQMIPFSHVTNEIAARTQPTLIDLFIASASGVVAFLAFGYKKIAGGIAGVAMAASLVPPLAVVGIGLAFADVSVARESMLLFLTNLVAIIISGAVVLCLFGFFPTAKQSFKKAAIKMGSIVGIMLVLCIPLVASVMSITRDIETKNLINKQSSDFFKTISQRISLENVSYESIAGKEKGKMISLALRVPQSVLITQTAQQELTEILAEQLETSVELDLAITPIASVYKEETKELSNEEKLKDLTQSYLSTQLSGESIYILVNDLIEEPQSIYSLNLYIESDIAISEVEEQLQNYLKKHSPIPLNIIAISSRKAEQEDTTEERQEQQNIEKKLQQGLLHLSNNSIEIETWELLSHNQSSNQSGRSITLTASSWQSKEETKNALKRWQENAERLFDMKFDLTADISFKERFEIR